MKKLFIIMVMLVGIIACQSKEQKCRDWESEALRYSNVIGQTGVNWDCMNKYLPKYGSDSVFFHINYGICIGGDIEITARKLQKVVSKYQKTCL